MNPNTTPAISKFQAPFTLDEFRNDILEVVLHYMRIHQFVTGSDAGSALDAYRVPREGVDEFTFYPVEDAQASAVDIGLSYEGVKHLRLVQTLERMYEFAYQGHIDSGFEPMEDESSFTFVSALVVDAHQSLLDHEWLLRGSDAGAAHFRCRQVADLANARNILEGGESYFSCFSPGKQTDTSSGLSIRQMALLAGMEEMSIRAAANPKRANPLKTESDGNSTYVPIAAAKEWLESKGLYVPVTYHFKDAFFDMRSRPFTSSFELNAMLVDRFDVLAKERSAAEIMLQLPEELVSQFEKQRLKSETLGNREHLEQIAAALDLPAPLLVLRAEQLMAREHLNQIEYLINEEIAQA